MAIGIAAISIGAISCSETPAPFIGAWEGTNPIDMTAKMPGAKSALETISIDFINNQQSTEGEITLYSDFDIICPVLVKGMVPADSCNVSFSANAIVKGTWNHDVDDHDDLLINYDYSTIEVKIDNSSIKNVPAIELTQSQTDSLSTIFKLEIETTFRNNLTRLSTMEDIKVSKDGKTMSLEVKGPKYDLRFKRLEM